MFNCREKKNYYNISYQDFSKITTKKKVVKPHVTRKLYTHLKIEKEYG